MTVATARTTSTAFVSHELPLWGGLSLFLDGNSKTTAGNGTYANPKPNSFSLPHVSTCPGSTPSCRASCYVHGLQRNAPEVWARYVDNERTLHRLLMGEASAVRSARILAAWIADNCPGGFRWHVSGDVMHARHARWIVEVSQASGVPCWIYTRSLPLVHELVEAPNLAVNVSADDDNLAEAIAVAELWGARICYMDRGNGPTPELPVGSVIFPDYPQRGRETLRCRACGWIGEARHAFRTEDGGRSCPVSGCGGSLALDPTAAPWWQALTPAQRRQVCPPDFFGQSESLRCGVCTKCLKPARPAA
jgi:hypothetical protein